MKTWKERLDARIDRCPGCDQWRFDQRCKVCDDDKEGAA
jgi:hypothetical protein